MGPVWPFFVSPAKAHSLMTEAQDNTFDKYAIRVVASVIAAILLWVGVEVLNLRDSSIRAQERGAVNTEAITEAKRDISDLRAIYATHIAQDRREVTGIEARIMALESVNNKRPTR